MKILILPYVIPVFFYTANMKAQERKDSLPPPSPKDLKEVKITGRKQMIEMKKEKLIFHIANTVNENGFNAFDLLKKLPGVVVDNQNNIILLGSSATVMIDGRPVQLSAQQLSTLLKSMSSTQISDMEVISNPSAKYDASGAGGLINIVTKKNDKYGLNGTASTTFTYGLSPKYNNDLSLNYGNNRLNSFLNLTAANEQYNRKLTSDRTITQADDNTVYYSDNLNSDSKTNAYSLRTGVDYTINSKSTLGAMFSGNISRDRSDGITNTAIGVTPALIDSLLTSGIHGRVKSSNYSANANYRYKDTLGTTLTIDGSYLHFNYDNNTFQPNAFYTTDNKKIRDEDLRNVSSSGIDIYALKADYSVKLLKGLFEAGWKSSIVKAANDFSFYNVENGVDKMDTSQTNHFDYKENINAVYANYSKSYKRFSWQAGLRLEQTNSKGTLIPLQSNIKTENIRHYVNLFPSAMVSYDINKTNTFGLLYSRRIDRPNYQYLNPFETRMTILLYDRGDPFLVPQYTDKVSLMHIFNKFLTTSLNYSHTSNLLNQVIDTVDGSKIIYQRANLGTQRRVSIDISGSWTFFNWWNSYNSLNLYNNSLKGRQKSGIVDINVTSYSFYSQQTFTLPANLMVDVSCSIIGPFNYGTFKDDAMWKLDVGLRKKVLKNRGTITLNGLNIFNQMIIRAHLDYGGIRRYAEDRFENRFVKASFAWNFGNQKKQPRKWKSGAEDESKRAK
ncbi:outer membrane beta-barrel protein [Chitinophaga sancti]|uniref:outer membrane beta-barrel protein n=1 Tax=Chitinophaga sancti TaxID=1004 RepID=UPI002A761FFB|nr:outer membrane beta-barrel protein [Chitinophaga sancti]WPQ65542.1 outer membrane beta-barrel protein [Chitinophaga sancti]